MLVKRHTYGHVTLRFDATQVYNNIYTYACMYICLYIHNQRSIFFLVRFNVTLNDDGDDD